MTAKVYAKSARDYKRFKPHPSADGLNPIAEIDPSQDINLDPAKKAGLVQLTILSS